MAANLALSDEDFQVSQPPNGAGNLSDEDFQPSSLQRYLNTDIFGFKSPIGDHQQPIDNDVLSSPKYMLAGMGSGAANFPVDILNLAQRVSGAINRAVVPDSVNPENQIPSFTALDKYRTQNPDAYDQGNFIGSTLPWFAVPGGIVEGTAGKISDAVGNFLTKKLLGKIASKTGDAALISGTANAANNPEEPLLSSFGEGAKMGGELGAGFGVGSSLLAGAGRLGDVITANAEKAKLTEGSAYDAIKDAADAAGIKIDPKQYTQILTDHLNKIGQEGSMGVNKPLENDLYSRLDAAEKEPTKLPQSFSVQGIHSQLRGLNNVIGSYQRAGNNDAARIYKDLKSSLYQDLIDSLTNKGRPDLADQFLQTQKNWAQNVLPLRKYPTSLGDTARKGALMAALGHSAIPAPLETYASVGMGMHDAATNPLMNVFRRFGSTYKGGPTGGMLKAQDLTPYLSRLLLPNLTQENNP